MFFPAIYPELALFCGALIILLADVFFAKNRPEFFRLSYLIALLSCLISLYFISRSTFLTGSFFHNMIFVNSFTCLVKFVAVILLIFVIILTLENLENEAKISAEFLALLLISSAGGMLLVSANDFLSFYLSLEMQSLPLYLLAAINKKSAKSSESGMKYFILGSTASGLLLLGISIFYGFSGTTNFDVATYLYNDNSVPLAVILGFIFIVIAIFFKISAAPFHMWTPDVYEGSNPAITTFFATTVKFTTAMVLVRLFLDLSPSWLGMEKVLIFVGLASIVVGSFGAIKQTDIRRMLAYSSIGHIGFVILGLSALNGEGIKSCIIYMIIYSCLSIGNFGFVSMIIRKNNDAADKEIFSIKSLSGLAKNNPLMAVSFAILMLSTAGIPPLAGFFSKFYVLFAIIKSQYFITAIIAILFSVISAFYYLRIVKIMFFDEAKSVAIHFHKRLSARIAILFIITFNIFFILFLEDILSAIALMIGF